MNGFDIVVTGADLNKLTPYYVTAVTKSNSLMDGKTIRKCTGPSTIE